MNSRRTLSDRRKSAAVKDPRQSAHPQECLITKPETSGPKDPRQSLTEVPGSMSDFRSSDLSHIHRFESLPNHIYERPRALGFAVDGNEQRMSNSLTIRLDELLLNDDVDRAILV